MTNAGRNRRAFLRRIGALGTASTVGGLAGCLDELSDGGADDTDDGGEPTADASALRAGLEIGTVFTAFGGHPSRSAVDPNEPGGGRLITVEAAAPGQRVTIGWRETVERERTPTGTSDAGVGTPTPTPVVDVVERSGTITATGLASAHEPFLPMYWDTGETTTDTSAMWLSGEAYRELRDSRRTAWSRDVLTRISWVGKEAQERIRSGVQEVDEVYLEAQREFVEFELTHGDRDTSVRAIQAHDSFGNEYLVAADETNPLVLKFTYDAVSVGFTGFDTALWSLIKAVFSGYQVLSIDGP